MKLIPQHARSTVVPAAATVLRRKCQGPWQLGLRRQLALTGLAWPLLSGCAEEANFEEGGVDSGAEPGAEAASDSGPELPGEEVVVHVDATSLTFVDLDAAKVLDDDAAMTEDWDLAFQGWDVFTNSGPSGPGRGAGFGPMDELDFLFPTIPATPFLRSDVSGGAFLDWYDYDGSSHSVWSRFHVYGVTDGERFWKVQILSYYGQDAGAPVSAVYQLRYAEVTPDGALETVDLRDVDATAGYPEVSSDTESACLNLEAGELLYLTPAESLDSTDWHLCFRREAISVNGDQGGPGGISAVNVDAEVQAEETLEDVQQRSEDSELEHFLALGYDELTDGALAYRGDGVVSVFGDQWFDGVGQSAIPASASWLVLGADGERFHSVVFREIQGTKAAAGKVTLRARRVQD